MSGDPLLGVTRDSEKRLKVIETERGPIAPRPGQILERAGKRRGEEGTLLAGVLPDRCFDVVALRQTVHGHLPKGLRKLAHAFLGHLPPPSCAKCANSPCLNLGGQSSIVLNPAEF